MSPPVTERTFAATPFFTGRTLVAPFQMATDVTDTILVRWRAGHIGTGSLPPGDAAVDAIVRHLSRDGQIIHSRQTVAITANYASGSFRIPLNAGFLLAFVIGDPGTLVAPGELFVAAALVRDQGGIPMPLAVLVSGSPSRGTWLAWPGSPIEGMSAAPWYDYATELVAPGAGNEWSYNAPNSAFIEWQPTCISSILNTDATVIDRICTVRIADNTPIVGFASPPTPGIPANSLRRVSWAMGTPGDQVAVTTNYVQALPSDRVWGGAGTIVSFTPGFQGGDTYTGVVVGVRERIRAL
jgi:hypothetical protein